MNESVHHSFYNLEVWKKARILKNEIWHLCKCFPPLEKYRLTDQIIRSSISISATIAEGHGRYTFKDQIHFCIMVRGSLSETHSHLFEALDCNYIDQKEMDCLVNRIAEVARLLNAYISYLRKLVAS